MCIGLPMQVSATRPGHATVQGRGQRQEVDTALVGDVQPGDWLLVFLGAAREVLSAERAAEVNEMLDLLDAATRGQPHEADPGFALPSHMTLQQLAALSGSAP